MPALLGLSLAELDTLAEGSPSADTLTVLRTAEDSKRRLLLLALWRSAGERSPALAGAFDLLQAAEKAAGEAVGAVIARPLVDAWAIRCLQATAEPDHVGAPSPNDLGFAGALAAAAAVRAGLDFEIQVPSPAGRVFLPGLGTAHGLGGECSLVRGRDGLVEIVGAVATVTAGTGDGWLPTRSIQVGQPDPWSFSVEDLDPYRDCFGHPPADRLPEADWHRLSDVMAAGWGIVAQDHPGYAAIIRQTLHSVVPLAGAGGANPVSAASQRAYGSIAMSVPPDPMTAGLLLVHEAQHMTLGAILDVMDLCEPHGEARYHAPWRLDPRPVRSLLQGTYAHLAVADFWRMYRHRGGERQRLAEFEFAYWRELTARAAGTLANSGELTAAGHRFVDGIAATVDRWQAEPVPALVAEAARDVADVNAVTWRLRNQGVPIGSARLALERWQAGDVCANIAEPVVVPGPPRPSGYRGLGEGIRQRALSQRIEAPLSAGDKAFLAGDFDAAVRAYQAQIVAEPMSDEPWAGLVTALRRRGPEAPGSVLFRRPELVRELYRADQAGSARAATAEVVAEWLAAAGARAQGDGGSM